VKGGDYTLETLNTEERGALQKVGADVRIVPFENGFSTTRLLEQLRRKAK
jgi:bifunctional ADP-heptose synthase (sugar kinase/adenylyltransferase)